MKKFHEKEIPKVLSINEKQNNIDAFVNQLK